MQNLNLVVLAGRLVADPKLRELPSGAPVANFSVAVNRTTRKKDGSFEDALEGYFDCQVFDGLALSVMESFKKGAPVQLSGTLLQKTYESNDGNKVSKFEIRVRSIGPALLPAKAESKPEPVPA